ncbi:hypothetical protein FOZ63_007311, partial [Perkinsus olseni]
LAAVLHACALSGFGGNDTVGELGRRLAGQSWELYSFGGATDGRNLVKTAVELWWLQGRVPARLARYLRESLKLLAPDEKRVAQLLLRLPEVRDRAPTSDKEGRKTESWSLRLLDGPQPNLVTKLLVWSPSGEVVATDDLTTLRDLIGVSYDREAASAVRKVASLLAIPWEAYPTPIIRCTRPGAPDKLVNIIIVKRGGWIPSDLVVSSWASKAPTVALFAEDSYNSPSEIASPPPGCISVLLFGPARDAVAPRSKMVFTNVGRNRTVSGVRAGLASDYPQLAQ